MPTRPETVAGVADAALDDAIVLVTGATDGVGREIALALGRLGATVIAHGRSPSKAQSLERDLEATDAADFDVRRADFTDLGAVRDLADSVASDYAHLDVVYNNAAAYFDTGDRTDVGVERTIAVNHLAPFILTNRLRDHVTSAGGRIVTTSSAIHRRAAFDVAALDSVADYDGMDAYAQSKFANVLFTFALADRLEDATATCFHPGFIPGSGLYRNGSTPIRAVMGLLSALPNWLVSWLVADSKDGAAAALYLGLSADVEGVTEAYFDGMKRTDAAPTTRDETLQQELWEWSERFLED
jgi:NAD(P)-dependent dehydrogenase (short-subunit alcohol dehydrogenase family)